MKRILAALSILLLLITPYAALAAPLEEEAFVKVAEKVGPSVVTVSARIPQEFSARSQKLFQQSNGSGFIIDINGYVVTNRHVINDAKDLSVKLADGREFEAVLVNNHPAMDVALLKIKKPPTDLRPAALGDSSKLKVGQWVAAIGAPFGFANTLTKGIVSALDRPAELFVKRGEAVPSHTFIQTDASINPGNSGGPLVNLKSEVIGINTLIASPEAGNVGLAFAIPINAVKDALPKLKSNVKTSVGWVGLKAQKPDDDLRTILKIPLALAGLLVSTVEKGGPAAKAGLKELDLILEVGGRKFSDPLELEQFIQNQNAGQELAFTIWRKGKTLTLKIRVEKQ